MLPGHSAVVFDAVGTLIEPWPGVDDVYAGAARTQGVVIEPGVVLRRFREAFTNPTEDPEALATSEAREFHRWRAIVRHCLREVPDVEAAFRQLWAHFAAPSSWRLKPGAAEVIEELAKRSYRQGVASNFDARLRAILRGHTPLQPLEANAFISSEVGWKKPHPAFYQAVIDGLELRPEQIVFVGDDPICDAEAPVRAGMSAVLIGRETGEGPPARVAHLVELLERLP